MTRKRLFVKISTLILAVFMLFTLCGCKTYRKILRAFESEGWEVMQEVPDWSRVCDTLNVSTREEAENMCKVHALRHSTNFESEYVYILEFETEMEATIVADRSHAINGNWRPSDFRNGNCILVPTSTYGIRHTFVNA